MTIGVPKPAKRTESEQVVERLTKAWARRDRWRAKAIAKAKWKPRPKVKARNELRIARKAKAYRTVIASDFHKRLRYEAWERSKGLCECNECVTIRKATTKMYLGLAPFINTLHWSITRVEFAYTEIPVWFVRGGMMEPWRRFRSREGETHHTGYRLFGLEDPAEIELVLWVWKACHQRIEAKHSTRRRFLTGK